MATKKRSRYVRNKDWDRYKHIVQKFLEDDSGRQTIGWCRNINQMLYMGEDKSPVYEMITIEALCYYNAFRNWPINKATVSGELDDENLVILIPKSSIKPYLNKNGYFQFNWSEDRFIINGIPYKPDGDTEVAQAKDEPIVFQIILRRDRDSKLRAEDFNNAFADIFSIPFLDINGEPLYGMTDQNSLPYFFTKDGQQFNDKFGQPICFKEVEGFADKFGQPIFDKYEVPLKFYKDV